jgi:hypothetical protein
MPFYPALPQPVQPKGWFAPLALGASVGSQISSDIMKNRLAQSALDQQQGQLAGREQYAQTKDPTSLIKYDPELMMKLNDQDAKMLSSGLDLFNKAAPYLDATNPDPARYEAVRQDLGKISPKLLSILQPANSFQDPQQLGSYIGKLKDIAPQAQVDLARKLQPVQVDTARQLSGIEVGAKTALMGKQQEINKDIHKFQNDLDIGRMGVHYNQQLGLQGSRQKFEAGQAEEDRGFKKELATMTDERGRQNHFLSVYERELQSATHPYDVQIAKISAGDGLYETKEAREYAIAELSALKKREANAVISRYGKIAQDAKVPFYDKPVDVRDTSRSQTGTGTSIVGKVLPSLPPADQFLGATLRDQATGKRYISDGKQWSLK